MTIRAEKSDPGSMRGGAGAAQNPVLRKLERLAPLSDDARDTVDRLLATTRNSPPRSDLFEEGEVPESAVLILQGLACRYRRLADGRRQITGYLLPGDLCDPDLEFLGRMDHAVGTLTPCRIARVSRESLSGLLSQHPSIAEGMRRAKVLEEAILREWVINLGSRSATERLAHLFCELLVRFQAVGLATQDSYEFAVSQAEIGDTMGLSTVHVNRTLQALRGAGLIELKAGVLRIRDVARLHEVAEFTPTYLAGLAANEFSPGQWE